MLRKVLVVTLAFVAAFVPAHALAGDEVPDEDEGVLIRINGDVRVAEGETVSNVVVIRGDAIIDGTVRDNLFVINGDAIIGDTGRVDGDINMIRGDLELAGGSRVDNVMLLDSDLNREQGSVVTGDITRQSNVRWGFLGSAFWIYLWLSMTVAVILAGLIFAAVGGRQLERASDALTGDAAMSIAGAVFLWVGAPILAVLAFITVVGIPFGLGILLIAMPAMWFLGYIVAGTRIGLAVTRRTPIPEGAAGHPYLAAFLGLLILQIIALVPVIGWLIALVAGLYGAGALALIAFRGVRGPGGPRAAEAPTAQPGPA
jgi:hypothetical protein